MTTLRDIARESGYSKTSVWLALKESPKIPEDTRIRIRQIADALGYVPNAAYKHMLKQVRAGKEISYRSTVALIHCFDIPDPEERNPFHRELVNGAHSQAKALGYEVETFWAKQPKMRGKRLSQIIESRGIKGVVVMPMETHQTIDLDWEKFAAVTIGHTLTKPRLNLVETNNQQAMALCLKKLHEKGYRKIGVVMRPDHEDYRRYSLSVPYLWLQSQLPKDERSEVFMIDPSDPSSFIDWYESNKFEAIVTTHTYVVDWLKQCGYRVPEDVGIVFPTPVYEYTDFARVNQTPYKIGMAIIDMLDAQLGRAEFGCPVNPKVAYTDVDWVEGPSLTEIEPKGDAPIMHSLFLHRDG
ncbi:LacI family DNA-binding transcriptional regulator [Pelagicoccus mobilis]|uniref:LacI family DNA-binding transcriptional regulator n=1 Tax=Pelagicoccus mobilis TaxID=415221 RepID=A0A934RSK1_9BACT|nr:LacI family DNA-binding transcriptional regulator [Pelagicoccus mobilis]MBK1876107.1 LacI family DNA-binding transcriptional regulator [Pelagicoccus mobilis]